MGIEADTLAAFDVFADATATVDGASVPVTIDLDVEIVDGEGNIRKVAALVHAKKSALPTWSAGAALVAELGNFKLRELVADDGFMLKISATKAT